MILTGLVYFGRPRQPDGGYLTRESFGAIYGAVPVCWAHWREGDYIHASPALWFVTDAGLEIMHALDEAQPEERKIADLLRAGVPLFWSHGLTATPEETRRRVARYNARTNYGLAAAYNERPLTGEVIAHLSLFTAASFDQEPVSWVG